MCGCFLIQIYIYKTIYVHICIYLHPYLDVSVYPPKNIPPISLQDTPTRFSYLNTYTCLGNHHLTIITGIITDIEETEKQNRMIEN